MQDSRKQTASRPREQSAFGQERAPTRLKGEKEKSTKTRGGSFVLIVKIAEAHARVTQAIRMAH
jgi:mRNA-degrading endonuclease RelE of RelBE toxin-antitoxin system